MHILILAIPIATAIAFWLHRKVHGERTGMTPLAGYIGAWVLMISAYSVDPLGLYESTTLAWMLIGASFTTFIVGYAFAMFHASRRERTARANHRTRMDAMTTKPIRLLWLIFLSFEVVLFVVFAFEIARTYGVSSTTLTALRIDEGRGHVPPGFYFFVFAEPIVPISAILALIEPRHRVRYLAVAGLSIAMLLTTSGRSNVIFAILWALCAFAIYQGPALIRPRVVLVAVAALLLAFAIFQVIGNTIGKSYQNSYVYARFGDHPPIPAPFVYPYLYLEGPVPTFSAIVTHTHSFGLGRYTFRPVFEALGLIDHQVAVPSHIQTFQSIPYPFNVSTYVSWFYRDFGVPGVVVGPALLGFLLGRIYATWRRRPSPASLALAAFACVVAIASIGDLLLLDLSRLFEFGALASIVVLERRRPLLDQSPQRTVGEPRVGLFIPSLNGGGAERAVLLLARFWPTSSPSVVILRSEEGPFRDDLKLLDPRRVVSLGLAPSGLRASLRTPQRLARVVDEHNLDVIIAFLSIPSVVSLKLLRPHVTIIYSAQNPPGVSRTAGTFMERLTRRASQFATYIATSRVDAIASTSAGTIATFERSAFVGNALAAGRVAWYNIPNPIDPALLNRPRIHASHATHRVPKIVSAGRLVPQKRFDVFLQALAEVRKVREIRAVLFGDGALLKDLRRQAASLHVDGIVDFRPFEHDLDKIYRDADLFVLTSDFEGFGNVIVEALAYGLPVVATDAPYGPSEILGNGRYGLLTPCGDQRKVAAAILAALPGGPDHARLVSRARQRAARYTAPEVAQEMRDCAAMVSSRRQLASKTRIMEPIGLAAPRNSG